MNRFEYTFEVSLNDKSVMEFKVIAVDRYSAFRVCLDSIYDEIKHKDLDVIKMEIVKARLKKRW